MSARMAPIFALALLGWAPDSAGGLVTAPLSVPVSQDPLAAELAAAASEVVSRQVQEKQVRQVALLREQRLQQLYALQADIAARRADAEYKVQRAIVTARDAVGAKDMILPDVAPGQEHAVSSGPLVQPELQVNVCGSLFCGPYGRCDADQGVCVCDQGYAGATCSTPQCPQDCGSHGLCVVDRCVCEPTHYGDGCEHLRCPEDCNSHGYCFMGRCQCSGAWMGESCMEFRTAAERVVLTLAQSPVHALPKGYTDVGVSTLRTVVDGQGCPRNCSGHGVCGNGFQCTCDKEWGGDSCADTCEDECYFHGQCIHGACLCEAGYAGATCNQNDVCSGHGVEDMINGTCTCDPGWMGTECNIEMVCRDPLCSGHGVCAFGTCICGAGYSGELCEIDLPECTTLCGDHGTCNQKNSLCECDVGWTGRRCDIPEPTCPNGCSGHGTCVDGACDCWPGWTGEACTELNELGKTLPHSPCDGNPSGALSLLGGVACDHVKFNSTLKSTGVAEGETGPQSAHPPPGGPPVAVRRQLLGSAPLTASWMLPTGPAPTFTDLPGAHEEKKVLEAKDTPPLEQVLIAAERAKAQAALPPVGAKVSLLETLAGGGSTQAFSTAAATVAAHHSVNFLEAAAQAEAASLAPLRGKTTRLTSLFEVASRQQKPR